MDTEAWVLHKLGRTREAQEFIERAILHATDSRYHTGEGRVEMLYHHGAILGANGETVRAKAVFRDCAARGNELPYGQRCRLALEAL